MRNKNFIIFFFFGRQSLFIIQRESIVNVLCIYIYIYTHTHVWAALAKVIIFNAYWDKIIWDALTTRARVV